MKITGQVLGDMRVLPNAIVEEINLSGYTIKKTTTDANGNFSIDVTSSTSMLRFSANKHDDITIQAKDFKSYVDLDLLPNAIDDVEVNYNQKSSKTLLYVLIAGLAATTIYFGTKDHKPKPKKLSI